MPGQLATSTCPLVQLKTSLKTPPAGGITPEDKRASFEASFMGELAKVNKFFDDMLDEQSDQLREARWEQEGGRLGKSISQTDLEADRKRPDAPNVVSRRLNELQTYSWMNCQACQHAGPQRTICACRVAELPDVFPSCVRQTVRTRQTPQTVGPSARRSRRS